MPNFSLRKLEALSNEKPANGNIMVYGELWSLC